MKLIVNKTELEVSNAYTERDEKGTLSAVIEVPYDSMDFADLKLLFMSNDGIITKETDDGEAESWDGFKYVNPPVDTGELYKIVLSGEEETYQIERTRQLEKKLAEKETSLESVKHELSEKENEMAELAEAYADMLYEASLKEIFGNIESEEM